MVLYCVGWGAATVRWNHWLAQSPEVRIHKFALPGASQSTTPCHRISPNCVWASSESWRRQIFDPTYRKAAAVRCAFELAEEFPSFFDSSSYRTLSSPCDRRRYGGGEEVWASLFPLPFRPLLGYACQPIACAGGPSSAPASGRFKRSGGTPTRSVIPYRDADPSWHAGAVLHGEQMGILNLRSGQMGIAQRPDSACCICDV